MTEAKSTSEPLILALLQDCIELSKNCDVVKGAFSVGSLLYLPKSSSSYGALRGSFQQYDKGPEGQVTGLYLSGSWSRHLPGNTHAEANALALFREAYEALKQDKTHLPDAQEVLKDACCAKSLVEAHVERVYLGVQEPPDYVQCEGVRILQDGGVQVWRVQGLEEQCLLAARRGL